MFVKACVNGARDRRAHPGVPATPAELATAAAGAVAAGAVALHMHPRDVSGAESLDRSAIGPAVEAVRASVDVPVGVSTGAWFLPDPADRIRAVEGWDVLPDFASVNVHEDGAVALAQTLLARGVGVEAGLWHADAARLLVESGLAERSTRLLLEPLMPDLDEALAVAAEMEEVLDGVAPEVPRLLHGYGATTWAILDVAVERSFQVRVGLEDTLTGREGAPVVDNAALVAEAVATFARRPS